MVNQFARVFCLLCLATLAGASRVGEGSVASNVARVPSSMDQTIGRERRDARQVWPETLQLALFGAGLGYVGLRLGKRERVSGLASD